MTKTQNKPGYLRKTLWCIVPVILIQVLKKYLDRVLPGSVLFHHYLLTGLQLVVLLWTIIILLFPSPTFLKKVLILIGTMALPELLFTYWIKHPSIMPVSCRTIFNTYCTQAETNIIQFNPESSAYNDSLFYTLKPASRFVFSNPEFSDSFYTNKMGLRDDDNSLLKPEIICLGDSYAMGWGVEQNESLGEQVGIALHKKVLNAAISSYGTARELKNLYRLDTANLQTIILQYCRNDYRENREFVQNNYSLSISSEKVYDSLLNDHYWSKLWFPFKRSVTIAKFYAEKKTNHFLFPQKITWADSAAYHLKQAALYFTDIMFRSAINFKNIKVLVVDLDEKESMNNDFLDEVNRLMMLPGYAAHFNNNLITVPVAELLTDADYYILDPHIRPSGHKKIAERLSTYLFQKN
ncbi:MAG: hypothetical protein IPP96_10445 [Chitinophagaceae bacterium]|nr:hypothetical protein [Chitinophagaceae bacterium]